MEEEDRSKSDSFRWGGSEERCFVKVRELASGPEPGSRHSWSYASGYCVYFPISAKFILSFLLTTRWSLIPYRKPKSSVFSMLGA